MILYNPTLADVETDNHWLPAIHVDGPPTSLLAFVTSHTNVVASWAQGTPQPGPGRHDGLVLVPWPGGNFLKPDVTAPWRPGARRAHHAAAGPDNGRQRPAWGPVHGNRGHLDVGPARRGRLRARQGLASALDARPKSSPR